MTDIFDKTPSKPSKEPGMIVFTICSRNFMGYAQALWESLKQHNPDVIFHVGLCDEVGDFDVLTHPFEIIQISELGISRWEEMVGRYDITELNTSLKPFLFLLLFSRYPGQPIFYIDPDILAFAPFREISNLLDDGANCVLTPHVNGPSEYAEMNDQQFLRYGVYNLGFCLLRATPEVRRVVSWWARRLETQCVVDLEHGLFVDQKWADLFPAYIDKTAILRHPGYNVAYWNLAQRLVGQDNNGDWTVNNEKLRFFHFSGNKIENENEFSRHTQIFTIDTIGDVKDILAIYRLAVERNGHAYYRGIPYAFNWGHEGRKNVHTPASMQADRQLNASHIPHLPLEFIADDAADNAREPLPAWAAQRRAVDQNIRKKAISGIEIEGFCAICNEARHFSDPGLLEHPQPSVWSQNFICNTCQTPSHTRAVAKLLAQTNAAPSARRIMTDHPALLTCNWLALKAEVIPFQEKATSIDVAVICDSLDEQDLAIKFTQAFTAIAAGGHILVSYPMPLDTQLKDTLRRLLKTVGFSEVRMAFYWSEKLCHFGDPQIILIGHKPAQTDKFLSPAVLHVPIDKYSDK
ncbi:MAG: hypothetical protein ABF791_05125 [Acetobacter sp.]|uniref:hypothetical protein n=1 Tax=Acetobacter sp. TaxID=440 RepID=UPI0039E98476